MSSKILVSFIIPHKNIPNLLCRCISSIPKRDDLEIIIVDDNSDEEKVDLTAYPFTCDENRVVILDKSGKRQGHARNLGLDIARGEWICFIDSDDFFFHSINEAIDYCIGSKSDIIYYKSTNLDCETYLPGNSRSSITNNSIDQFISGDTWGEHMIRYRHPVPWGKFIRHSLIKKHAIRFPEIEKAEDFEFSYLCGHYAKSVEAINVAIYCVTSRIGNITSTITPTEALVVAKNEIDFLRFMIKKDLTDTPSYKIIEQDVFALLEGMKYDSQDYHDGIKYLDLCGFDDSYKRKMFNKIARGRTNSKIKNQIYKIMHFCH